jgi:hypothetical protein
VDTSKISFGEMVAGASGVALFLFMLLPWYGASASVGGFSASVSASAWEAFSFIDILLFLVAAVAIGLVVARATGNLPDLPQPPGLIVAGAGAFALVLILFRLLVVPDGGVDVEGVDFSRKIGIFLGLIAAAGITFGGWTAMNERASGQFSDE